LNVLADAAARLAPFHGAEDFRESALYSVDYQRRFRDRTP
jgi:hypothetical protein